MNSGTLAARKYENPLERAFHKGGLGGSRRQVARFFLRKGVKGHAKWGQGVGAGRQGGLRYEEQARGNGASTGVCPRWGKDRGRWVWGGRGHASDSGGGLGRALAFCKTAQLKNQFVFCLWNYLQYRGQWPAAKSSCARGVTAVVRQRLA